MATYAMFTILLTTTVIAIFLIPAVIRLRNTFTWQQVTVLTVRDGDSLKVSRGRKMFEVRLHGIDAPEFTQDYGREARLALKQIVGNGLIKIRPMGKCTYGRVLAQCRLLDGTDIGMRMVESGHAWAYMSNRYKRHERRARRAKSGLWAKRYGLFGLGKPTAPSRYRKAHASRLSLS